MHSHSDVPLSLQDAARTRALKYAGRAFLFLFGLANVWAFYNMLDPDTIAYLDIGDECFHGNWRALGNAYWSPLYAIVVGAVRRVLSVPMKWEYPLIHFVDFVIFLLVICCFEFFWGTVFRSDSNTEDGHGYAAGAWWVAGYALFAITALMQRAIIGSPDFMVTGFQLLAAALLIRARSAASRATDFLLLGVVLGFGYLAKAPMFPIAFVFFVAAAVGRRFDRGLFMRVCLMVLAFAIISVPFVVLLSSHSGSFTFGQSGKLNYLWIVNHLGWEESSSLGRRIHPIRQIWRSPDVHRNLHVLEFGSPFRVTYALQYDRYYWNEGFRAHLDVREWTRVTAKNVKQYVRFFFFDYYVSCLTILLLLAALRADLLAVFRHFLKHWPLLLVIVCGLGMFAAILVLPRYVGGYLLLLWAALFLATGAFGANSSRLARAAAFTLVIMVLPGLCKGLMDRRKESVQEDSFNKAVAVLQAGIHPGDRIAYVGDPLYAFWPKLDKVFIVAMVRDFDRYGGDEASTFWQSSQSDQAAAYEALKKAGVVAILASTPSAGVPEGWRRAGNTNLCLRFLR
jgi:hypothetical protein